MSRRSARRTGDARRGSRSRGEGSGACRAEPRRNRAADGPRHAPASRSVRPESQRHMVRRTLNVRRPCANVRNAPHIPNGRTNGRRAPGEDPSVARTGLSPTPFLKPPTRSLLLEGGGISIRLSPPAVIPARALVGIGFHTRPRFQLLSPHRRHSRERGNPGYRDPLPRPPPARRTEGPSQVQSALQAGSVCSSERRRSLLWMTCGDASRSRVRGNDGLRRRRRSVDTYPCQRAGGDQE